MPVAATNWTLKIGGLVQHPLMLRLDQLLGMPANEVRILHYCVDGWSAVASCHGMRVRRDRETRRSGRASQIRQVPLFRFGLLVGVGPRKRYASSDDARVRDEGCLLQANHGAPLRLCTATKLEYKSVKYLSEINFCRTRLAAIGKERGFEWFAGV